MWLYFFNFKNVFIWIIFLVYFTINPLSKMASRIPLAAMNIYNGNSFSLNIMATKRGDCRNKGLLPPPLYDKWIWMGNITIYFDRRIGELHKTRNSVNFIRLIDVMVGSIRLMNVTCCQYGFGWMVSSGKIVRAELQRLLPPATVVVGR